MSDQAIQKKLKVTRDQLESFIGNHNTVRQFEKLFEVINELVIPGETTLESIQDAAHPIGEIFVQYPGKADPNDLYIEQTWTNVSSDFAGDFFRAEDDGSGPGKASAFGSGTQLDAFQRHGHLFQRGSNDAHEDSGSGASGFNSGSRTDMVTTPVVNGGSDAPKYDLNETRPVNQTIRIWERTA